MRPSNVDLLVLHRTLVWWRDQKKYLFYLSLKPNSLEFPSCSIEVQLPIYVPESKFKNNFFAAIAQVMKHNQAKFRAMGNMGDVLTKMGQHEEALAVFTKQLSLAKQVRDRGFEASAYGSLGVCHRHAKQFDKALGFHTQVST